MRYLVILLLLATPAMANSQCLDRESVSAGMASKGLVKTSKGLSTGGKSVIQVYRHPTKEEWAIVEYYTSGRACIRARGTEWLVATTDPEA